MNHPVYFPFLTPAQNALLAQLNYDESKVAPYELPEALIDRDGRAVDSPALWTDRRRPEILTLFGEHVYGGMLPEIPIQATIKEESQEALSGKATRRQVEIAFPGHPEVNGRSNSGRHELKMKG